ncbi:MAG: 50S ribosomal protein L1 [Myxococcales bacterium]|nr:50S ribosomal protein L1 [Myxococcales bacterium]
MAKRGKSYTAAIEKRDAARRYPLQPGVEAVLATARAKFDESVDVAVRLGVDPRKADQNLRGACVLPHGTGRTRRVLVFAKGEKQREAKEAGADFVGDDDLAKKVAEGWLEFDAVISTPDMMREVGKLGKVLGPRGLMPNPKVGTVTVDVAKAVREIKGGRIEYRVDKAGIVHMPIGRVSFGPDKIRENLAAALDVLHKVKPSTAKGAYLRSVSLSTTMGPSVKLDTVDLRGELNL